MCQCGDRPPDDMSTPSAEKTTTTQASTATQPPPPLGNLSFAAASYLAFDPPEDSRSFVLDMEFIFTANARLMFYVANKEWRYDIGFVLGETHKSECKQWICSSAVDVRRFC